MMKPNTCCRDLLRRVESLIEDRMKPHLDGSERFEKYGDLGWVNYEIHHELDELLCEVEKLGKDSDEVQLPYS